MTKLLRQTLFISARFLSNRVIQKSSDLILMTDLSKDHKTHKQSAENRRKECYAGINLTGYYPPGHSGAFAPKCVPSPRAFAQEKMPRGGVNKFTMSPEPGICINMKIVNTVIWA